MRRKRTSLRRLKARCRLGRKITMFEIMNNPKLRRHFKFVPIDDDPRDVYWAVPR